MKRTIADYPKLVTEWHPTKNGSLKPVDVSYGSHKKVWWICNVVDDHEWQTKAEHRVNGSGCPCCRGLKTVKSNCLATINPELSKQWHPTKNGSLKPTDVVAGSNKKVWWECKHGHEWQAIVAKRSYNGCPFCANQKVTISNCLFTKCPQISSEWHSTKNGSLKPTDVVACGIRKVWWECKHGHEWQSTISSRYVGSGCPICCESKGERKVASVLNRLGLTFESQAKFKTCKNKRPLPFDFFVKISNCVGLLIEYHGQQHYKPMEWSKHTSKMIEDFNSIKIRDKIKEQWAKNQQIPILIIPIWDYENVDILIENFINMHS